MRRKCVAVILAALAMSGASTHVKATESQSSTADINQITGFQSSTSDYNQTTESDSTVSSTTESDEFSSATQESQGTESSTESSIENSEEPVPDVAMVQRATLSTNIDKTNIENGQFKLTFDSSSTIKSIRVAIWSQQRQNNLKWYQAVKQSDGSLVVEFDYKNHQYLTGDYQIHVYTTNTDNKETSIALETVKVDQPVNSTATFSAAPLNAKTYRLTLALQNSNVKGVSFPTWSENKGQDDIKWYEGKFDPATKRWFADVPISNHKDAGKMITHSYIVTSNSVINVSGDKYSFPELAIESAKVEQNDDKSGRFKVKIVTNDPNLIDHIDVPIWSRRNGQDDIKWYRAAKQADGSFIVEFDYRNHKYDTGIYHVHAYAYTTSGQTKGIAITNDFNLKQPSLNGELTVVPSPSDPTKYIASVKMGSSVDGVQFPTWTEKGGQNDIKWYQGKYDAASGTWKTEIDLKNHLDGGKMQTHVWATINGKMSFVANQGYTIEGAAMTGISIDKSQLSKGKFRVTLTVDNPESVKNIQVPVWSHSNGQDDLYWYNAVKQSDGTFAVDVDYKNHKYDTGKYSIHTYIHSKNGLTRGFVVDNNLELPDNFIEKKIEAPEKANGKFTVRIKVANPDAVTRMEVPVWSNANGQDDIKWYQATKQSDGSYTVEVDYKNHKYDVGRYLIHAYMHTPNGQMKGTVVSNDYRVKEPQIAEGALTVEQKPNDPTKYIASIKLVSSVDMVQFPTWSEKGGQNDIKWYQGKYDAASGTWKAEIDLKNHLDGGKMQTHVWATQNGKMKFVANHGYSIEGVALKNSSVSKDQLNKGKFKVTLTLEDPSKVKSVSVPIWSHKNGQDDLKWYEAKRQADGTYTVEVDYKDHKYDTGKYTIHAYVESTNGIRRSFVVDNNLVLPEFKVESKNLKVEQIDSRTGIYRISIEIQKNPRITKVEFPTWTETNGQDDIRWYNSRYDEQKGIWFVDVKLRDNHYNGTKLNVHAYAHVDKLGMKGIGATSIILPETSVPQMVNHRGNHNYAPENSIPSFENANYYGVETDIQLTSDNRWVIMHDGTIDRMTNGSGEVKRMTFEQLRRYRIDAGAGLNRYPSNKLVVPTLEEYLEGCRAKKVIPVIEIKTNVISDANYNELVRIVNSYGFGDNAKFISFYLEPLQVMKRKMPQISTMYLTGSINDTTIAQAKSIGDKSGLNVLWTSVSADSVTKAKANGLTVGAWTVPASQFTAMRNAGVDFITTDD